MTVTPQRLRRLVAALTFASGALLSIGAEVPQAASAPAADPLRGGVDFNFHIRPLLSDRCFTCHGPDDKARKGKLDLRTRQSALTGGSSGEPAIRPGDPEGSELLRRLKSTDPDEVMPPPQSKLPPLTPGEIELVRRWIAEGAEFKEHWAFIPPRDSKSPSASDTPAAAQVASTGKVQDPIDAFIARQWSVAGLRPEPEASREVLIRRLSLDLTGLPPKPEEIDAFLADTSPDAYERLVDRLLASPHYGERMAQEWMDLARYADTYGYQTDAECDLSPWRDWVIRAFNENLPWDTFITWQLAGDLLEQPSPDQVLATAFNRLHRQTNEGGSIEEEFRTEYVADRVHTMGTAFLGLTLECARCHDHKYDPVSQRDYYRLFAYFNSIDESGLYSHFTRAIPTPVMLLWDDATRATHTRAVDAIEQARLNLKRTRDEAAPRFEAWRTTQASTEIAPPTPQAFLRFDVLEENRTPDAVSTNRAQLSEGPELVEGRVGRALRFSGDNSVVVKHAGHFGRTDPFSFGLWVQPTEPQSRAVVFHHSRSWTDSGSRGYELVLDEGRVFFALIHFWPGNAAAVRSKEALPTNAWTHLAVTYDGSSRAEGIRLYRDGREMKVEVVRDRLTKDIQHRQEWGDSEVGNIHLTLAARFRDNGFRNGLIDEFQVFDHELTPLEVRQLSGQRLVPAEIASAERFEQYLRRHDDAYRVAAEHLHRARIVENDLITPVREIMVMSELPEPRPTHLLRRGAYDAPGDPVEPGVPERIFPAPDSLPRNRLGLARWITDPAHPLTARVAVNRIWKLHFGRGLVATTWDFGAQGQLPSHPELLDWLARRLVESGWDRKAMHKRIVMTAAYRRSSVASPQAMAQDSENRWLARGPSHRLDAEQIRDSALAASGLLVPTLGGPSVKPYQPPGVWEDAGTGKSYKPDTGDRLHRRSLYTFWRRTAPPPSMLSFDATTREVCTAKREITTTPLQSLVLLNDLQFLEAARVLGEKLLVMYPGNPEAQAKEAFRRLTGRLPDAAETRILGRLHAEQRAYFQAHPEAAAGFVKIGENAPDAAFPVVDLAAATVLASAVMNHDEFVMKR